MKYNNSFYFLVLLLAFSITSLAQTKFNEAQDAFKKKDFSNALELYKGAFLESAENPTRQIDITFQIAECYRNLEFIAEAELWYRRAIIVNYPDPIVHFYYAEMMRLNRKFKEAQNEFENYRNLVPDDLRSQKGIEKCERAIKKMEALENQSSDNADTDNIKKNEEAANESNASGYQSVSQIGTFEKEIISKKIDSCLSKIKSIQATGDKKVLAQTYNDIAKLYYSSGENENAVEYFFQSLKNKEAVGDKRGAATALSNIGVALYSNAQYDEAIKSFTQSLKIMQEVGDKKGESRVLHRIGNIYYDKKDYAKAVEFFKRTLEVDKQLNNPNDIAASSNNLGVILYEMKDYEKSLEYLEGSLKIQTEKGNDKDAAITLNNIGNIKFEKHDFQSALNYYKRSIALKEKIQYKKGIAITKYNSANTFIETNELTKALEFYTNSEKIANEQNLFEILYSVNYGLMEFQALKKNWEKTYLYFKKAIPYVQFSQYPDKRRQISEMLNKFDDNNNPEEISLLTEEITRQKRLVNEMHEKQAMEMELKNYELEHKEAELKIQKTQKYAVFAGLLFILIVAFLIFRSYRIKKKQNEIISMQNEELKQQKEEITVQRDMLSHQKEQIETIHGELTDSIIYAERIQKAVLPSSEHIREIAASSGIKDDDIFILFKPRDIVSGDFYFAEQRAGNLLIAVADCTGHGVPGAFMSMLGTSFLNEIIAKKHICTAGSVLDELRDYTIHSLQQKGIYGEQKDGMDIVFIAYDSVQKSVQYAGAYNPLYLIHTENNNPELEEIKPDKMPVAIFENMKPFTNNIITVKKGDILYLSTDGFVDQFGGPKGKKFLSKKLKELLIEICLKPMPEQKQILNKTIEEWKNSYIKTFEQTDDITIVGIKIV